MKNSSKIFSLVILATASLGLRAQESPQILTLEECRQMALDNNFAMRNALDKAEAATMVSRNAFTKYFPNISAEGFAYKTNKGVLQYNLNIPLGQWGLGDLGLGDNLSYDFRFFKKGTAASLNLVQPIFMGGRIYYGNQLAHVGEEVAKLEGVQTRQEVTLKVEEYYWKLATLNAKKETVLDLIAMLDTLTNYVQTYVDAGITTRNELLQVKLKRNQMASNLVDLDNGINLVRMALSQFIGRGPDGNIDVEASPKNPVLPEIPVEYYVQPGEAVNNTTSYGLLTQAVKASELQEKLAVGENLPIVAGGAGYFYEHLLGQNHTFGAIYLTVAVPITDWWGGSYNIKKRKIETRMAKNRLEDASQLLMINMANSWNDIVSARDKISIAIESIQQAQENLRLNKAYYEAGIVTLTDLLQAQTLYKSSHDDYVESFGNFKTKVLNYRQATGQE